MSLLDSLPDKKRSSLLDSLPDASQEQYPSIDKKPLRGQPAPVIDDSTTYNPALPQSVTQAKPAPKRPALSETMVSPETLRPGRVLSELDVNAPRLQSGVDLYNAPRIPQALPTYAAKDTPQAYEMADMGDKRGTREASALMSVAPRAGSLTKAASRLPKEGTERDVMGISPPGAKIFKTPAESRRALGELAGTALSATMGAARGLTLGLASEQVEKANEAMKVLGLAPNPAAEFIGEFGGVMAPWSGIESAIANTFGLVGRAGRIAAQTATGGIVGATQAANEGRDIMGHDWKESPALVGAAGAGLMTGLTELPSSVANSNWFRMLSNKERSLVVQTLDDVRTGLKESGFKKERAKLEAIALQEEHGNAEIIDRLRKEGMTEAQINSALYARAKAKVEAKVDGMVEAKIARLDPETFQNALKKRMEGEGAQAKAGRGTADSGETPAKAEAMPVGEVPPVDGRAGGEMPVLQQDDVEGADFQDITGKTVPASKVDQRWEEVSAEAMPEPKQIPAQEVRGESEAQAEVPASKSETTPTGRVASEMGIPHKADDTGRSGDALPAGEGNKGLLPAEVANTAAKGDEGSTLVPAVKLPDGRVETGGLDERHDEILQREEAEPGTTNIERGFVNEEGDFLTRGEAYAEVKEKDPAVYEELKKEGVSELHSKDLEDATKKVKGERDKSTTTILSSLKEGSSPFAALKETHGKEPLARLLQQGYITPVRPANGEVKLTKRGEKWLEDHQEVTDERQTADQDGAPPTAPAEGERETGVPKAEGTADRGAVLRSAESAEKAVTPEQKIDRSNPFWWADTLPPMEEGTVRLYRGEGNASKHGKWWSISPEVASEFAGEKKGGRISYIDVSEEDLEKYAIENHPDVQIAIPNEYAYILPKEVAGNKKLAIKYKDIFTPKVETGYGALPEATRTKFEAAWEGKDSGKMEEYLHTGNKTLRSEWERRTGKKLPKAVKGTAEAIKEQFAPQDQPAALEPKAGESLPKSDRKLESVKGGNQEGNQAPIHPTWEALRKDPTRYSIEEWERIIRRGGADPEEIAEENDKDQIDYSDVKDWLDYTRSMMGELPFRQEGPYLSLQLESERNISPALSKQEGWSESMAGDLVRGNTPPKQTRKETGQNQVGETSDRPVNIPSLPADLASRAFNGTSHTPEKRGESYREGFKQELVNLWDQFEERYQAANPKRQEAFVQTFNDMALKYAKLNREYLTSHGNVMSSMIVGPARFPVERNRKRMEAADKRMNEVAEFIRKAPAKLAKVLTGPKDNSVNSALEDLRDRLKKREEAQTQYKAINAAMRKKDPDTALKALGLPEKTIDELKKPDFAGRTGIPSYKLTNNNAEIRRLKDRIAEMEKREASATTVDEPETEVAPGVQMVKNAEAGRLQLFFDGKPDEDIRTLLKSEGFKWVPSQSAWQRQLTANAEAAAKKVLDRYRKQGEPEAHVEAQEPAPSTGKEPLQVEPAKADTPADTAVKVEGDEDQSLRDQKKNLLAGVDEAAKSAYDAKTETAELAALAKDTDPTARKGESYGAAKKRANEAYDGVQKLQKVIASRAGYVTFDVPGGSAYKILNTKQALEKFKKQVDSLFPAESRGGAKGYGSLPKPQRVKPEGLEDAATFKTTDGAWHGNTYVALKGEAKLKPKPVSGDYPMKQYLTQSPEENQRSVDSFLPDATTMKPVDRVDFVAGTGTMMGNEDFAGISDQPIRLEKNHAYARLKSEGSPDVYVNQNYYLYAKEHYPHADILVNGEKAPVTFVEGGKIVGVVMPVRSTAVEPHISSQTLDFFGLQQAYESLAGIAKAGKEALPHLTQIGREAFTEGAQKFYDFRVAMKEKLGDLWDRFKPMMMKVWDDVRRILKSERGAVGDLEALPKEEQDLFDKYLDLIEKGDEKKLATFEKLPEWRGMLYKELPEEPAESFFDQAMTSFKTRVSEKETREEGMKPQAFRAWRTFEEIESEGRRLVDSGEVDPLLLARSVVSSPRSLAPEETTAILYGKQKLINRRREMRGALREESDPAKKRALEAQVAIIDDDIQAFRDASVVTGYEQSLGFSIRRLYMGDDYSFEDVIADLEAHLPPGETLTEELKTQVRQLTDDLEKAREDLARAEETASLRAAEQTIEKVKKAAKGEARAAKREQKTEDLENQFKGLSIKLKDMMGRLHFNFDPEMAVVLGQMAKVKVQEGITKAEDIIDAIYKEFADFGDVTKRDIRDAISGYGKTFEMSKEEIDVQLREARRVMRLTSALEDAEGGQAPLRSGLQRDQVSDEVRHLQSQVREEMKRHGIFIERFKSPEEQWKSALDGVKTRLKNQIKDLNERLQTGKKPEKRAGITYDAEAEALKAERDRIKAAIEEIEGKPELSPEQRVRNAVNAVKKSIEDLEKRIKARDVSPRTKESKTPEPAELKALRERRDALREVYEQMKKDAKPKLSPEERALKAFKKRMERKERDLQNRIDTGEYETPKREKQKFTMDQEAMDAQERVNRIQGILDRLRYEQRMANRTKFEKGLDTFLKIRRAVLLSGTKTLLKLTTAATLRMATTPIEEGIGTVLRRIPGLAKIAARAPREGGAVNLRAEIASLRNTFSRQTWKDFKSTVKTGMSQLDALYSTRQHMPPEAIEIFGRIHGALKLVPKRAEFFRALEKRAQWLAKNDPNADLSDPATKAALGAMAYVDANRAIFMNDNILTGWYKAGIRFLKQYDAKHGGNSGKILAATMQALMPIIKVPTNFAIEAGQYAGGAFMASPKLYKAARQGAESLTHEEADFVMRSLKKQVAGIVTLVAGFALYESIGGYYQKGEKRKTTDVKPDEVKVGDTEVPRAMLHTPILEPLQIGATIHRKQVAYENRGKSAARGTLDGLLSAIAGVASQVPFIDTPARTVEQMRTGEDWGRVGGDFLKSLLIPPDVQQNAKSPTPSMFVLPTLAGYAFENPGEEKLSRKPEGVVDNLKMGIPGLRQQVPINYKKEREKKAQGFLEELRDGKKPLAEVRREMAAAVKRGEISDGQRQSVLREAKESELQVNLQHRTLKAVVDAIGNVEGKNQQDAIKIAQKKAQKTLLPELAQIIETAPREAQEALRPVYQKKLGQGWGQLSKDQQKRYTDLLRSIK